MLESSVARYALIAKREDKAMTLLTGNVNGESVLPVFTSPEVAETHLILSGLTPEWSILEGSAEDLAGLLFGFMPGKIHSVTLNPPVQLKGGPRVAVEVTSIGRFLAQALAA